METIGSVQNKLPCVFQTKVVEENSTKRANQTYKVVACEQLRRSAVDSGVSDLSGVRSVATEKLDGTCVFVQNFGGRPWLWARHDRKLNKAAEKRFKKFQQQHRAWQAANEKANEPIFEWNAQDFKEVPEHWIAASGVQVVDGIYQPDDGGHTPGWVPVDPKGRQHCWHLSVVDLSAGIALVLQSVADDSDRGSAKQHLRIAALPLDAILNSTLELIGTNINGNPYKLGTKQQPVHCLVRHGMIGFRTPPPLNFSDLHSWFSNHPEGKVEGVVWHCSNGEMFKLHRHHLGLEWPPSDLRLHSLPVEINVDEAQFETEARSGATKPSLFSLFAKIHERKFESITDIKFDGEG